jgi:hypothetical protein
MELSALLLSRIQFAFTVQFHIIFPAFTDKTTLDPERSVMVQEHFHDK